MAINRMGKAPVLVTLYVELSVRANGDVDYHWQNADTNEGNGRQRDVARIMDCNGQIEGVISEIAERTRRILREQTKEHMPQLWPKE